MFNWRFFIQTQLQKFGYDIVRYPIMHFLNCYGINLVLDIGANTGQYAKGLRKHGYQGKIVSFEPLSPAYQQLVVSASGDSLWETAHFALGGQEAKAIMHVAGNSASSSLLDVLPALLEAEPQITYVDEEIVPVKRLDSVFYDYCAPSDRIFLKIDTQGYEQHVLDGSLDVLPHILGFELEMSLVPIYDGESLIEDLISFSRSHGFLPVWLIHGYKHPFTKHLLQVDGIFINESFSWLQ